MAQALGFISETAFTMARGLQRLLDDWHRWDIMLNLDPSSIHRGESMKPAPRTIVILVLLASLRTVCIADSFESQTPATFRVRFALPERFRVLTHQQFDVRIEAEGLRSPSAFVKVLLNDREFSHTSGSPETAMDKDADASTLDKSWTFRNVSIATAGTHTLKAIVSDGTATQTISTKVGVQPFTVPSQKKNLILFIGDGMGTAYRDAARIVSRSANGHLRQGFYDELLQMDQMPVSGMVMTHAWDRVVPDSANTAAAWATGNKTIDGALNVFPDNNDHRFRSREIQQTKQYALDNPRVESLWQYLKRLHGYRTGIVTTADVTDATPAAEGSHTITRILGYDIARQFVDGVFTKGSPFDVIMGGGKERFENRTQVNSGDTRNLAKELQDSGFTYVKNRTELKQLGSGTRAPAKLLGLFRSGNMNVAFDKLGLKRPADEPQPQFLEFKDQPFLDEMITAALATLTNGNSPFILLVEGASIDKQSHANHMMGQIWDTIEFDKAIGVGRKYLNSSSSIKAKTLLLVTADHDQTMTILGVTDTYCSLSRYRT